MPPTYEQKLAMHAENKDFAIFNELSSLNDSIKDLIKAVESSKNVSVDNLADAVVDLTPLQENFEALKGSVELVTKAIQSIPKSKELNMSGVEKLLGQIVSKEMDMSHMMAMTGILDNILYAVQTTASHSGEKDEVLTPDLKAIQKILNVLNENIVAIEIPDFDYEKLAKVIKANIKISGGGPGAVFIKNATSGNPINPATEEKQDTQILHTTDQTATGTLAVLNDTVELTLNAKANTVFQITYSAFVGKIMFEAQVDSVWSPVYAFLAGTGQSKTEYTNPASGNMFRCSSAGFRKIRVRLSLATSGSATINAVATNVTSGVFINFPLPEGGNNIGSVKIAPLSGASTNGTRALTLANTWYAVPSTVPTADYVLVVSKEATSTTIRFGFDNTGAPSATNGNKAPTHLQVRLSANQIVYYASSVGGETVNWTTKII